MSSPRYPSTQQFLADNPRLELVEEYGRDKAEGGSWVLLMREPGRQEIIVVKHCYESEWHERELVEQLASRGLAPPCIPNTILGTPDPDILISEFVPHRQFADGLAYHNEEELTMLTTRMMAMYDAWSADEPNLRPKTMSMPAWNQRYIRFATKHGLQESLAAAVHFGDEVMSKQLDSKPFRIIHGDLHLKNILSPLAGGELMFIDPDGLYSYPELDMSCIAAQSDDPVRVYREIYRSFYAADADADEYAMAWLQYSLYIMRDFFARRSDYRDKVELMQRAIMSI